MAGYRDTETGLEIARINTPAAGPRPDKGPMDDSELHSLVDGLVKSAAQYIEQEISPDRAEATKYYQGQPFGNEEKGRSQYISTDVRDGVLATLPPVLRIIFGPEKVVEFRPDNPEDVAIAEQATDYVNYVFSEENNGFLHTLAVLKDGLVRKLGIFKWVWDDYTATKTYQLENVSQEQLELLAADEEVELTRITEQPGTEPGTPPLFTVELTRTVADGSVCLYAVPPEEIIWNREARGIDDALIFGHYTRKAQGELIAMGIDPKVVEEHGQPVADVVSEEEYARNPESDGLTEDEGGEANEKTRYVEAYCRIDYDGDGIAELRKIVAIGEGLYVVENEPVDDTPFAVFCPDPEPHTMLGQSLADRLMDIQKLKSSLFRSTLDSAAASIFPRTVYKHGNVSLADILNTAIGAPIRTSGDANADVREFGHTFMGKELFPVLQYCDDVIERRTGQNKGAQGLDADALQSSTKTAVAAAVTASQAQQEMLVRIFAEGTLKRVFRGILKLLVRHQPRARMVRLRNQWVEVDPRPWNADMDVQVNVMLGSGLLEDKLQTLVEIKNEQAGILQLMGLENPIVSLKQYRDTLAEMAELRGRKNTEKYFKAITEEQLQQMAEAAKNTPPPPDPKVQIEQMKLQFQAQQAQVEMQLEQQKVAAQIQLEQMKAQRQLELEMARAEREAQLEELRAERQAMFEEQRILMEQHRIDLENDRLRDKQAADIALKTKELELKHMVDLREQEITAQIERERATSQSEAGA